MNSWRAGPRETVGKRDDPLRPSHPLARALREGFEAEASQKLRDLLARKS